MGRRPIIQARCYGGAGERAVGNAPGRRADVFLPAGTSSSASHDHWARGARRRRGGTARGATVAGVGSGWVWGGGGQQQQQGAHQQGRAGRAQERRARRRGRSSGNGPTYGVWTTAWRATSRPGINSTNSSLSWVHYCWENSMKVVLCNTKEELLQKGLLELMLDCLTCLPGKTFAPTHPRTISRINPARIIEHAVPGPVRRGLAAEVPERAV